MRINTPEILEYIQSFSYNSTDIIYLSGSLIEKVGNDGSDVDVYVLTSDMARWPVVYSSVNENKKTFFGKLGNTIIDIEVWNIQTVISIFERIRQFKENDLSVRIKQALTVEELSPFDVLSFVHRFCVGNPIYNIESFTSFKNQLDKERYCSMAQRFYVNIVDNAYEDIASWINGRQFENASIALDKHLIYALMARLFSQSVSVDREKWAYHLAKQHKENDVLQKTINDFDRIYFNRQYSNIESHVQDAFELMNRMVTE